MCRGSHHQRGARLGHWATSLSVALSAVAALGCGGADLNPMSALVPTEEPDAQLVAERLSLATDDFWPEPWPDGIRPVDWADDEALAEETGQLELDPVHLGFEVAIINERADAIDSAAQADGAVFVASRKASVRPTVEPSLIRVRRQLRGSSETTGRYDALVLDPSEVVLAESGRDRVLAAWSQRDEDTRFLVVHDMDADGDPAEGRTKQAPLAPWRDKVSEPKGSPLLVSHPDGWMLCTNVTSGPPQCGVVHPGGSVSWQPIPRLKSYPLWKLVPFRDGFHLFATTCPLDRCRQSKVLLQSLNKDGTPRGRLRTITRFDARPETGVFEVAQGTVLFGRRVGAKHGTALLVTDREASELDKRWTRARGAVPTADGALVLDNATLYMRDGHPVGGFRPRRWTFGDGLEKDRDWPLPLHSVLPSGIDQQLLTTNGLVVISDLPVGGVVHGVVLKPLASLVAADGTLRADGGEVAGGDTVAPGFATGRPTAVASGSANAVHIAAPRRPPGQGEGILFNWSDGKPR